MKEIDGVKYVTKQDIIEASVKVTKKLADDSGDPMVSVLSLIAIAELTSELFPKENKENTEE